MLGPTTCIAGETPKREVSKAVYPPAPGGVLEATILNQLGIRQAELARALRISKPRLNMILKGRRQITPEIALRLAKVIGHSPRYWLELRANWDLFKARERLGEELGKLRRLSADANAR